jgi:uncharacterized protein (DUF2342 family)
VSDTPFGNFGFMGDLMKMLGQQGPNSWLETARALALNIARGDDADPNPLPVERQRLEQYGPLVARHIEMLLGVPQATPARAGTRSELSEAALRDWAPLVAPHANSPTTPAETTDDNPMGPMLAQLGAAMGPLFIGFQLGSVAGHFSETAWSLGAIPLPREDDERTIIVNNVARFADEWSLDHDQVMIYAVAYEHTAATYLRQDGTGTALRALLFDAVRDAQATQGDIMGRLSGLMQGGDMSELMSNPEQIFDGIELGEETPATIAIDAASVCLRATFDFIAGHVTHSIVGPTPLLDEALRRHRRSDAKGEESAAALFGISIRGSRVDVAEQFVREVATTWGIEELSRLFQLDGLPSAEELLQPAVWRSRVTQSPFG